MDPVITIRLDARIILLLILLTAAVIYYLAKTIGIWLENLEHKKARGKDLVFNPGNRLFSFIKYKIVKEYMEFREWKQ